MLRNRLFNVVIAILLVTVIALTVREAAATVNFISEKDSAKGAEVMKCMGLPSRYSLRTEYVRELDMWVIRTEDGPAGIDGGFTSLLSDYRTCSR